MEPTLTPSLAESSTPAKSEQSAQKLSGMPTRAHPDHTCFESQLFVARRNWPPQASHAVLIGDGAGWTAD